MAKIVRIITYTGHPKSLKEQLAKSLPDDYMKKTYSDYKSQYELYIHAKTIFNNTSPENTLMWELKQLKNIAVTTDNYDPINFSPCGFWYRNRDKVVGPFPTHFEAMAHWYEENPEGGYI
jgi:hypothetical protein